MGISIYTRKQWHLVWDRKYFDKIKCKFVWLCYFPPISDIPISSCSMPDWFFPPGSAVLISNGPGPGHTKQESDLTGSRSSELVILL